MANLQQHWNRRFSDSAPESLTWFTKAPDHSLALIDRFGPGKDASVIDVGAGNGRLADHLLARGYRDITLLDLSQTALEQTRARLGKDTRNVELLACDITTWSPARQFDIWHDRAVFHFMIGKDAQNGYLRALRAATRPGSTIIMATFSPEGPEKCSGLPVQRYDAAALAQRLGPPFTLLFDDRFDHITPGGGRQNFTIAAFRHTG